MCADRQLPSIKHKLVLLGDQSVGKTSIINRFMYDFFDSAQYQATIGIDFFSKNITVDGGGGGGEAYPYTVKLHIWDTAGQERYRSLIPSYVRNSAAAIVVYDISSRESFLSAFTWVDEIKHALGIRHIKGSSGAGGGGGGGAASASASAENGGSSNSNNKSNDNDKGPSSDNEKGAAANAAAGVGSADGGAAPTTTTASSSSPPAPPPEEEEEEEGGIVVMLVGNKLDIAADGGREVSAEEAEQRARENNFLFCEVSAKNGTNVKQLFRSVAQALPAAPRPTFASGGGAAEGGESAGGGGGGGRFGAATRSPFLISPSAMTAAGSGGGGAGGGPGNVNSGGGADGGGGCC